MRSATADALRCPSVRMCSLVPRPPASSLITTRVNGFVKNLSTALATTLRVSALNYVLSKSPYAMSKNDERVFSLVFALPAIFVLLVVDTPQLIIDVLSFYVVTKHAPKPRQITANILNIQFFVRKLFMLVTLN